MNRAFSIILIIFLVFSLNFGVAKAEEAVVVFVNVVDFVVDVVVDTVTVVANVVTAWIEIGLVVVSDATAGVLDLVGADNWADKLQDYSNALSDDVECRFRNLDEANPLGRACPGTEGVTGAPVLPPSGAGTVETWFVSGASQPLCDSVTLSGINAQGHNYAVVRDGQIVAQVSADKTSYTDTGLTPHTNYEYKIRIPYPEEAGFTTADSDPIKAYTKCLPQCGFGAKEKSVAKFGKATLVWNCNYNDPVADKGSCQIEDINTDEKYSISSTSGTLEISTTASTTFVLSCANVDGAINVPQSIEVLEPGIKEVKP